MEQESENFKFFQHVTCEYFPCHQVKNCENFNCLFCYCPLYALGSDCGGDFIYTEKGIKNCIHCTYPHEKENYDGVLEKVMTLIDRIKEDSNSETLKEVGK